MLNQVVYTRCSPYRDLKNRGQVVRGDGFGIFSVSPEIFEDCSESELGFINSRLAIPNAAKENGEAGLFNSYEYVLLPGGKACLTYEVARPLCREPRKNGRLHRGGTFIKQCLAGDFSKRVSDLVGSSVWDAYLKSENDYYLDNIPNPEPPLLPQIDERAIQPGISDAVVTDFVSQGRNVLVQKGISFLLHEYSKPESERKVLLIKDTSEHVELWVLALTRVFPASLANTVTFSTNMAKLGNQTDSQLFYYTDSRNNVHTIRNQAVEMTRHPYCMIVGYHPADTFSVSLRQSANSNFCVIDGVSKTAEIPGDYDRNAPFYLAASEFGEEYQYFCRSILANLPWISISLEIVDLYEAYKYLILGCPRGWDYDTVIRYLRIFAGNGVFADGAVNARLLQSLMEFVAQNYRTEENCGFAVSSMAWEYAVDVGEEDSLVSLLADEIWHGLYSQANVNLEETRNRLDEMQNRVLLQKILSRLFSDSQLENIYNMFGRRADGSVPDILELFYRKLELCGEGLEAIEHSDEKTDMVYYGINAVCRSQKYAERCLERINGQPRLFCEVVTAIGRNLEETGPEYIDRWWEIVTKAAGESIIALCSDMSRIEGTDLSQVERLLCYSIRASGRYDDAVCQAFINSRNYLGLAEDSGEMLFSLLIRCAGQEDLAGLAYRIRGAALNRDTESRLFKEMDGRLGVPDGNINEELRAAISAWAYSLNAVSRYCAYCKAADGVQSARCLDDIYGALSEFIQYHIPYSDMLADSEWYKSLVIHGGGRWYDGGVHIRMICLFTFKSRWEHQQYIQSYIQNILALAGKKNFINGMLGICESICFDYHIPVPGGTESVRQDIENALKRELYQCNTLSMAKHVQRNRNLDENVKEKMTAVLMSADAQKPGKTRKGILGIFGRKNR